MSTTPSCPPPPIDLNQLLQLSLFRSIFREEETNIDQVLDAVVNSQIADQIVNSIIANIPQEYVDMVCLFKQMEDIRALRAALRGEEYESRIDKVVELAMTLQMLSAFQTTTGATTA